MYVYDICTLVFKSKYWIIYLTNFIYCNLYLQNIRQIFHNITEYYNNIKEYYNDIPY